MSNLHEVDQVAVNLPLLPLARQTQREVEELRGAGGGSRHEDAAVPGEADRGQGEAVEVDLLLDPRPRDLLQRPVRAHGVQGVAVRGEGEVGEGAGLHNDLVGSIPVRDIPLVDGAIVSTGHQLEVIR